MSGLEAALVRQIEATGPIDLASYMTLVLAHRTKGYYATRDPLGAAGDFVTAPEISQLFGELIGAFAAQCWLDWGRPRHLRLVELGPGRGTLMRDALRATRGIRGFHDALSLHLVETSPTLRRAQESALMGAGGHWHRQLAEVPEDGPWLVIANEFLDALPIRQLVRTERGLQERRIGVDAEGRLCFVLDPRALSGPLAAASGGVVELAPAREAAVSEIAERLAKCGGTALLIDYGALDLDGRDSFQAVRRHRHVDPLTAPGETDVTSLVAFRPLIEAAVRVGLAAFGPLQQRDLLCRLGIEARFDRLVQGAEAAVRSRLIEGVERLLAFDGMGEQFKALALTAMPKLPPGFAGEDRWR